MPKKQQELAGVGAPSIKELDDAAEEYVKVRDQRMAFTKKEVEARTKVADLMKEHKLSEYHYDGERLNEETGEAETIERVAKIEMKEKISVRVPKDGSSEPEEDEDKE